MIEFRGALTPALIDRARQRHPGRLRLAMGMILLLIGIAAFLMQPAPLEPSRHLMPIFAALIGGAIVTSALAAKREEIPNIEVSGSVSEQRLTIRIGEHEEHLQWPDFSAAIDGRDYFVLQRSQFFNFILGREFFRDDASWEELRSIIARNVRVVQPQTMARAVVMAVVWIAILVIVILMSRLID